MRHAVFVGVFLLIAVTTHAQSDEALIAEATSPLPDQLRDGATVVITDSDGNRTVLREGTNAFVCSPDDPAPGFRVGCTDGSLTRSGAVPTALTQYGTLRGQGLSENEILTAISAGVEAGTIAPIPAGAMHFILSGPDKDQVELLIVIRLPDATEGSTGLSTESSADQAWLMFPGTHQAHVMIGSPPYGWSPNK